MINIFSLNPFGLEPITLLTSFLSFIALLIGIGKDYLETAEKWKEFSSNITKEPKGQEILSTPFSEEKLVKDLSFAIKNLSYFSTPLFCLPFPHPYYHVKDDKEYLFKIYKSFAIERRAVFPFFTFHSITLRSIVKYTEVFSWSYFGPMVYYYYLQGLGHFSLKNSRILNVSSLSYLEGEVLKVDSVIEDNHRKLSVTTKGEATELFYRKKLDSVILKDSTRSYITNSFNSFLKYDSQFNKIKANQNGKIGFIFHGEKGTGKSEVAKSFLTQNTYVYRLIPSNLEELVLLLNYVNNDIKESYSFKRFHEPISLPILHKPYKETISTGASVERYKVAKNLSYEGSIGEFNELDQEIAAQVTDYISAIIIDDMDRIDFSDEKHIPALLHAIDTIGSDGKPIVLVATTNDYTLIPDVIRRPGRFSFLVKFDMFDTELIDKYIDNNWKEVTPEQRDKLHNILMAKAPAWAYSIVAPNIPIELAIDTLEEASIQNWKFENISTENTDSYTFSDANHFYDPDDIDELEEYIDAEY